MRVRSMLACYYFALHNKYTHIYVCVRWELYVVEARY